MTTDSPDIDTTEPPATPQDAAPAEPGPYVTALEAYLAAADWLGVLDGPWVVNARSIAAALDRQHAGAGVQSALVSSFDKVLSRLEQRKPPPAPVPTDPAAPSSDGTVSIFTQLDG